MNEISLETVSKIYQCSQSLKIKYHPVEHHQFYDFCISLKKIRAEIKRDNYEADDNWRNFLSPLRQYQFQLFAAPLPFNYRIFNFEETSQKQYQQLKRFKCLYPEELVDEAQTILSKLDNLSQSSSNSLLSCILEILKESAEQKQVALLLKQHSLISPVEVIFSDLCCDIKLVVPNQIRKLEIYEKLIIVGCSYWFPDYIFTAPHSSEIHLVFYNWIQNTWKSKPVFLGSVNVSQPAQDENKKPKLEANNNVKNEKLVKIYLEPEDILLPTIDINKIAEQTASNSAMSNRQENIDARLFLLEGIKAVFLDESAENFVINLAKNGDERIKKIPVTEIEENMFILLRTSGGGDYIITLANQIVKKSGKDIEQIISLQKEWKNRLKTAVRRDGLTTVSQRLVKHGCNKAESELNLRNWMSDNTIEPRELNIILHFLGFENRINQFENAAKSLKSAHLKAGRHIKKLLLQKVGNSDINKLELIGTMNFELDEVDGGSLTAYRVIDIASNTTTVSSRKIAQPFEVKEY